MAEQNASPQPQPAQPAAPQPPQGAPSGPAAQAASAPSPAESPPRATTSATDPGAARTDPSGTAQKPDAPKQETTAQQQQTPRDTTRELLDTLALSYGRVSQVDRQAAQAIRDVVQQGGDLARHTDAGFRHQLAYAVQDTEKALRVPIAMPAELRIEMVDRAGSAPGLENERMLALMRSTASLGDRKLVQDIRSVGQEVGSSPDQNNVRIASSIDVLENRARLAPRAPEGPLPTEQPGRPERASAGTAPSDGERARSPSEANQPAAQQGSQQHLSNVTIHRTAVDVLLDGMRGAVEGIRGVGQPPWEPPHTPMKARFAEFEERIRGENDTKAVNRAEQSGRAALEALQGFQNNEGAGIMSRIQEAARSNPGGMEGVISEMRPGGRFADLRTQFNSALDHDRGFAAAYEKASTALAQYGESRTALDAIIAKSPAPGLGAKFEALDAQIGEAAGKTPSSRDGMSKLDDITKQLAEIFQRAVDGVRSMFNRAAGAEATARPGPSPGMG